MFGSPSCCEVCTGQRVSRFQHTPGTSQVHVPRIAYMHPIIPRHHYTNPAVYVLAATRRCSQRVLNTTTARRAYPLLLVLVASPPTTRLPITTHNGANPRWHVPPDPEPTTFYATIRNRIPFHTLSRYTGDLSRRCIKNIRGRRYTAGVSKTPNDFVQPHISVAQYIFQVHPGTMRRLYVRLNGAIKSNTFRCARTRIAT